MYIHIHKHTLAVSSIVTLYKFSSARTIENVYRQRREGMSLFAKKNVTSLSEFELPGSRASATCSWFVSARSLPVCTIYIYVCICIYVYTNVYIYVYIYTCICTHIHIYVYVCTYVYMSERSRWQCRERRPLALEWRLLDRCLCVRCMCDSCVSMCVCMYMGRGCWLLALDLRLLHRCLCVLQYVWRWHGVAMIGRLLKKL